jgi:hypothetical protein
MSVVIASMQLTTSARSSSRSAELKVINANSVMA